MPLSRHSVGTYQEMSSHATRQKPSVTVISARWATVDWSWPKEWNYCAQANLQLGFFFFFLKHRQGMNCRTFSPNPRTWGESHHHFFFFFFTTVLSHLDFLYWKFRLPSPGKNQLWVAPSDLLRMLSDMDYRIFSMCTAVNAYDCHGGVLILRVCTETQWKLTLGKKKYSAALGSQAASVACLE